MYQDHLIPAIALTHSFPERLVEYFQESQVSSMPLTQLLQLLAKDFPPLFYSSPDQNISISRPSHAGIPRDGSRRKVLV